MKTRQSHVFALTGGIGSGKSTVSTLFRGAGVPVVCADEVARAVVAPGSEGLRQIVSVFSGAVLDPQGRLDREKLGAIVFKEKEARSRLNALVHPLVREEVESRFARLAEEGAPLVCYDIPLLFETEQQEKYRPVVVVSAPEDLLIARVQQRDGLTRSQVEDRLASQISLKEKCELADYVIENDGTLADLRVEALEALRWVRGHH